METNVVLAVLFWGCLLLGMPESRGQEAEWRKGTYPDGTLRYEGYFRAGKPAGEMKRECRGGERQARVVGLVAGCVVQPEKRLLHAGKICRPEEAVVLGIF